MPSANEPDCSADSLELGALKRWDCGQGLCVSCSDPPKEGTTTRNTVVNLSWDSYPPREIKWDNRRGDLNLTPAQTITHSEVCSEISFIASDNKTTFIHDAFPPLFP